MKESIIRRIKSIISNNDILKKAASGFFLKISAILLNYAFIYLISKYYGIDSWGIMALCLAIINIFTIFSRLGVDVAILKFASVSDYNEIVFFSLYKKGFKLIISFSIIISLILYCFSDEIALNVFSKAYLSEYIKVSSFGVLPYSILMLNSQMYRAKHKTNYFFFYTEVLKFLIPVILILLFNNLTELNNSMMPIYSFVVALYFLMFLSGYKWIKGYIGGVSSVSYKDILNTALPLFLGSSAILIMNWVDTLMLGFFTSDMEIGVYNLTAKISMVPSIVLVAVNGILAPKISNLYHSGNNNELQKVVKNASKVILMGSLPIFIVLILFNQILFSFFEIGIIDSYKTLMILLVGQFFNVYAGSVAIILQMTGKQKVFSKILMTALCVNIFLNAILIKIYGINGAAIATSSSYILWNTASVVYIYKKLNILTIIFPKKIR
jgi:O-antigen/teichoic acid export membrane protein